MFNKATASLGNPQELLGNPKELLGNPKEGVASTDGEHHGH
jgi:hypothetical protein